MNDKRKSIVIFILICIVLLFFIVGGVRFVKTREAALAPHIPNAPITTNPQPESPKPQENSSSSNAPLPPNTPQTTSPSSTTPSSSSNRPTTSGASSTPTPTQVPATGPSYVDFMLTGLLVMLSVYFAVSLKRTKNAYKRVNF